MLEINKTSLTKLEWWVHKGGKMKNKGLLLMILWAISAPAFAQIYTTPYQVVLPAVISLIDNAHSDLYLGCYSLTEPTLISALIAAKNRGVAVHIILDLSQSRGRVEKVQIQRLIAGGITDISIGQSSKHQLIHVKMMLVDGQTAVTGSWNFSSSASLQDNILQIENNPADYTQLLIFWNRIKSDMENPK